MKKFILFTLVFMFSMSLAFAQVQSGTFTASMNNKGYTLDKNSGKRSVLLVFEYPVPFDKKKPQVVLNVTTLDADKNFNIRYNVRTVSVSRDNFLIEISTWADTKIYSINGTWIAHAENDVQKKEMEQSQKSVKTIMGNQEVNNLQSDSISNNLNFLKKLNGKYPKDVKLFDNTALTQRLKKLLGEKRYNFLVKTWAIETPMQFIDNVFVASACQEHNCDVNNFIIVYDFSSDVLFAGIRENGDAKKYSEDGSDCRPLHAWWNGPGMSPDF